jgi:hypothetical protein
MTDFLGRLVERSLGTAEVLRPRVGGLFEPGAPAPPAAEGRPHGSAAAGPVSAAPRRPGETVPPGVPVAPGVPIAPGVPVAPELVTASTESAPAGPPREARRAAARPGEASRAAPPPAGPTAVPEPVGRSPAPLPPPDRPAAERQRRDEVAEVAAAPRAVAPPAPAHEDAATRRAPVAGTRVPGTPPPAVAADAPPRAVVVAVAAEAPPPPEPATPGRAIPPQAPAPPGRAAPPARRAVTTAPEPESIVNVHIERLEVLAAPEPPTAPRPRPREPRLSLEDYLARGPERRP